MMRERGKERDGWRTERGVGKELKEWTAIEEEGFFFLSGETQARMYKKKTVKFGWDVKNVEMKETEGQWGGTEQAWFNVARLYEVVSLVFLMKAIFGL